MMKQPDVSGESNNRTGHNQVQQGEPGIAGHRVQPKVAKFSQQAGRDQQEYSAREHLGTRTQYLGRRQRKLARKSGRHGPTERRDEQRDSTTFINRSPTEAHGAADERRYPSKAHEKRQRQARGKSLGSQEENLGQGHEHGNRGQHHRRDSGRNTLFGPKQKSIVTHENQHGEEHNRKPLPAARRTLAYQERPTIENQARDQEAHPGQKERRHLANTHTDREESGTPHKINDREGQ